MKKLFSFLAIPMLMGLLLSGCATPDKAEVENWGLAKKSEWQELHKEEFPIRAQF